MYICASLWKDLKENKTNLQPPNTKNLLPRNGRNSTIPSPTLHVVGIDWHQQWTRRFRGRMVTEQSGSLETSRRTSTFGWHMTQGTRGLQTQGCGARRLKEVPSTSVVWGDVWRGWTWNWGQEWFGKDRRHSTLRLRGAVPEERPALGEQWVLWVVSFSAGAESTQGNSGPKSQ